MIRRTHVLSVAYAFATLFPVALVFTWGVPGMWWRAGALAGLSALLVPVLVWLRGKAAA